MSWDAIHGHDVPRSLLQHAWSQHRLAHAYLLVGPDGIGKKRFARELGKALLCERRPAGALAACDRCDACVQVEKESHPDFHPVRMLEDKNEFTVNQIREACNELRLKPMRGGHRVLLLEDAERLNVEAANCFLKTLEEPPPRTLQLLIAGRSTLLKTILSRCQMIRFAPLGWDDFSAVLREQGIDDATTQERLQRIAGGSPGLALALNDAALWDFRQVLLTGLANPRADTVDLAKRWCEFCAEAGSEAPSRRRRARLILRLLLDFLSDVLRVQQGNDPVRSGPEDRAVLEALAGRLTAETIVTLMNGALEADVQILRWIPVELILEAYIDQWAQLGFPP